MIGGNQIKFVFCSQYCLPKPVLVVTLALTLVRLSEKNCAHLTRQMLCAVRYCHSKGIIHRDLKLENFIFANKDMSANLIMIDFGLSKHFTHGDIQHEAVGTPYTVAPEVSCDQE